MSSNRTFLLRSLLRFAIVGFTVLAAFLLAYPLWLGPVLQRAASAAGVSLKDVDVQGYGGLVLQDVFWQEAPLELELEAVRLESPFQLIHSLLSENATTAVEVNGGVLRILPTGGESTEKRDEPPAVAAVKQAFELLDTAGRFLQRVQLTDFRVEHPALEQPCLLSNAEWQPDSLSLSLQLEPFVQATRVSATRKPSEAGTGQQLDILLETQPGPAIPTEIRGPIEAQVSIQLEPERLLVLGEIEQTGKRSTFSVSWQDGALFLQPTEAQLDVPPFPLPSTFVMAGELLEQPTASARASWQNGRYEGTLRYTAQDPASPAEDDVFFGKVEFTGDLNTLSIGTFEWVTPWLNATLSEPLQIPVEDLQNNWQTLPRQRTRFSFTADFGRQNRLPLSGQLNGTVQIEANSGAVREARFSISSEFNNLSLKGNDAFPAADALPSVSGSFNALVQLPAVQIDNLRLETTTGSAVTLKGGFLLEELVFETPLEMPPRPASLAEAMKWPFEAAFLFIAQVDSMELDAVVEKPLLDELLKQVDQPEELPLENFRANLKLNGTREDFAHSANISLNTSTNAHALPSTLQIKWDANNLRFNAIEANLADAAYSLQTRLSAVFEADAVQGKIEKLDLAVSPEEFSGSDAATERLHLQLVESADFEFNDLWDFEKNALAASAVTANLSPLNIQSNGDASLRFAGSKSPGPSGNFDLKIGHLPTSLINRFLPEQRSLPTSLAEEIQLTASFSDAPLDFSFYTSLLLPVQTTGKLNKVVDAPFRSELSLSSSAQGLKLDATVSTDNEAIAHATAQIPVQFATARYPNFFQFDKTAPLSVRIDSAQNAALWEAIEQFTGIEALQPTLHAELAGSANAPTGRIAFYTPAVTKLPLNNLPPGFKLPDIQDVIVDLQFCPEGIQAERISAQINGKQVTLSGNWPLQTQQFEDWFNNKQIPDWNSASAQLDIEPTSLARFAESIPPPLKPEGTISASLALQPGKKFTGRIRALNLQTFPIQPIGSINDINLALELDDRKLNIIECSALLGEREVAAKGSIEVAADLQPRLDLSISGNQLPFARAPGMIIRGSPSVSIKTREDGITWVTGDVQLLDSVLVIELAALRSQGISSRKEPPFFNVEVPPFDKWRLDLALSGNRFLRVRSPVLETTASIDMALRGSLANPFAVGEVTLQEGVILFPYAALKVENGRVLLEKEDPYTPKLDLRARGRSFGYEIFVEVSGTDTDPRIQLSSSPLLDPSDILLMLTVGLVPHTGNDQTSGARLGGVGVYLGSSILRDLGLIDPLDNTISIRIGEQVTTNGRSTFDVEYKVNDKWSLIGAYDRFEQYTLDLKRKIFGGDK